MNILIVTRAKLPVVEYGGTERVVWALSKMLTQMGHSVTLLCKRGSMSPYAKVIEMDPSLPLHRQIPDDIDVVHFNSYSDPLCPKPYIVTIHGNRVHSNNPNNSVYVSRNHAERNGSSNYVHNGLDWSEYGAVDTQRARSYYHFLGKAAWRVKNVRGAIRIIDRLDGAKLKVLGGTRLNFKMGFRFTLSPRADFCGMVGGERKLELLKGSKGLIFPVLWDEPFGLAVTESLYCGAPVFGSERGSLPELVTPDVGFLSNDESEIVEAIRGAEFSSSRCHEYAAEYFGAELMARRYVEMYERVLNNSNSL